MEEIAIIGIGCRVPGADNIDEFWRVLVNSENHIIDVPEERWNNDAFYSENRDEAGKTYVKKAGFIKGHDEWDNKFFGVSDTEAINVDPQQRLVLECTQMALEDAGLTKGHIQKTQTGVYIGAMNEDYKGLNVFEHKDDTNYSATGMSSTIISARVSYFYDLRGPCMVVDTACSSSMIAIHLGSQAIRTGDCEMAICGGVNCMLSPGQFMTLCKAKMLSPTGQCQSFCDTADGYGRGEGCGIVIVKSYEKAVRDGNKIWGIIKTASNQDGRAAQPITAPSGEQQKELLKKMYRHYGIDATTLQYIEAHGTGTAVGDPTEVNALGAFIAQYRSDKTDEKRSVYSGDESVYTDSTIDTKTVIDKSQTKSSILIGSVKSNIGHLESAAGVAGLIKVLLMMKNGKYVPSLHVKKDKSNINRKIALDLYGLDVSVAVTEWLPNDDGDRICCVNCFGFGGSNTHAIVIQKRSFIQGLATTSDKLTDLQYKIICISNVSTNSLKSKLQVFGEDLEKSDLALQDVSFTSVFHRDHFTYRTLLFGRTSDEIQQHATRTKNNIGEIETKKAINIIFVFCGVGTTWTGMCKEMMSTHSTFRKMVSRIDEILQPLTGWSMAEKFQDNTDYSDPFLNHIAIFCTQVALFELWKSWGIHPKAIIGQSVGEVAAAFASGALHLEDAIQVIFHRSKILSKMTGGKMMVVGNIAIEKVESLCRNHGDRVTVAVYSSPLAGTVSGDADAVDLLKEDLQKMNENIEADIMITPLSVQCAYHSRHMGKCTEEIQSQLKNITKGRRETDHYSTVTGQLARENDFQTGKYWADNIRKPVLFMNALLQSTEQTAMNVFVELGPRQVLRAHLKNILGENLKGVCLPSMNARKECQSIYSSLGKLYELGAEINWKELVPFEGHITPIPRHVFQKSKVLHIPKGIQMFLKGIQKTSDSHMFLRQGINGKAEFHLHLDKETSPFVYDHYMYNNVLVPGATYVEAAFEIGLQKSSLHVSEMEISIEFVNVLWPKDNKKCEADVDVTSTEPNKYQYEISQKDKLLCKGQITPRLDYTRKTFNVVEIKSRCQTLRTKDQNYECLNRLHFQYGETLRVIENSWSSDVECIVELKIPDSVVGQRKVTHIHPCIIDGLFQIAGILGTNSTDGPALPKGVASFVIDRPPQQNMFGYSQIVKSVPTGNHYNFFLLSLDGQIIAKVNNFYIKKVTDKTSDSEQNTRHSLVWREITVQMNDACSERNSEKEGVTAVFASEKFISFYKQLNNKYNTHFFGIETDDVFGLMQKDMHSLDSILFAPVYHIKDIKTEGKWVFDSVKRSFSLLSRLFSTLQQMGVRKRVFVVTENVIGLQQTTNVCGSELWGMVRSALIEGSATDVKLIDMTFTNENGLALQKVIQDHEITYNEFLIENGKIHFCEVLEADDQTLPLRRKVHFEMSENAILKTSSPNLVKRPFFDMTFNEPVQGENSQQHKIRLEEICLHDSSVFLTSLGQEDDTFSTKEDIGHAVVCIEGIGRKQCNTSTEKRKVGFCFPVNASAVISVPSKCTFDPETMTKYIPGMFTVGVIIWNIAAVCMQSKNVLCIVDDNSSLFVQLIRNLFSARTNCLLSVVTQAGSLEFLTRRQSDSCTVVILAKLPFNQFERIATGFPVVQKLICIEGFISKREKMLVTYTNENMKLHIFQIENMFSQANLTECVPKIFNSFRSTKTNLKQTPNAEKGIFSLPYPVLKFENKNGKACFPMMVSKDNVFRTNGCYIVVGGLTGLGWELVQYMANLGAKVISTFSRRRPDNHKENDIQRTWDRYSCRIIPVQVDITDIHQLRKGMKTLLSALDNHVKIRGVLHGGGVTRDKFLKDMTEEDIDQVLMPKVLGTWNLHEVTRDIELDFFIMHSSVVSVFGNQGQCNYAAGNSFQDSFAHYRRSIGLCGQSINWTALSLGMATENQLLEKYLSAQGFYYLSKEEIRECFMLAVMANQSQMMFGKFDWQKMQQNQMVRLNPTKFENILKKHSAFSKNTDVHAKKDEMNVLIGKDPVQQKEVLLELVKSKIVETFVVDENNLTESTEIVSLGIDSMAAMSFTNVIFDVTNVRIPIGTLFDESATIGSVASYIQTRMQGDTKNNQPTVQPDEKRLKEYLTGDITFMQKTLLDDFVKDPFSPNIMRQVDFEIKGLEIQKNDMKQIVNHLVKINPDLRRIFKIEKQLTNKYQPVFLGISEVDIEIKDIDFDMICQDDSADERRKIKIDITKDLPIKVMMATGKDTTRIRIYVHAVLGDLSGITNLFIDIAHICQCHFQQKELPVKATDIDLAEAVRRTILPQSHELTRFWNNCFQRDIEPFTLSSDINDQLEEQYWKDLTLQVPTDVVTQMMNFINNQSISVYHFIISTYMVLLHEKTGKYLIPLVTFVDMRTHVKQLQPILQSCSNAIPVIGDLREMGLLSTYLKKSSHQLIEMLQHSAYPYELIQEEMVSDDLRKHIGRHRFIMENMTSVRNVLKQDGVELRIGNLYYKRHVYETTLHVEYDTLQNVVTLHFGYNGKAISDRAAEQILDRLLHLITVFVQSPHKEVKVLLKETSHDVERPDPELHSNNTEDDSRLNLGKELKTLERTLSSSTTEAILDMPREASKQELIYKGKFAKQTTKGWEHSVQLKLVRVISAENNRELILTWGTGRKMRIIHRNHISEVEIKRTSEMVYVVVKTYARYFIFKSPTLRQAKEWLEVFKQADREVDITNSQEMMCHF